LAEIAHFVLSTFYKFNESIYFAHTRNTVLTYCNIDNGAVTRLHKYRMQHILPPIMTKSPTSERPGFLFQKSWNIEIWKTADSWKFEIAITNFSEMKERFYQMRR